MNSHKSISRLLTLFCVVWLACLFAACQAKIESARDDNTNLEVDNGAPVVRDLSVSTSFNTSVEITLVAQEGKAPLVFEIVTSPEHGTLNGFNGSASFTYSPETGYSGHDSLTYRASDGLLNSKIATVTINVRNANSSEPAAIIADHTSAARFDQIPPAFIQAAKDKFRIAYGHTSHGSQLITGQTELDHSIYGFVSRSGSCSKTDSSGRPVFLCDSYPVGDLGNPDRTTWETRTRTMLNNNDAYGRNLVLWSWCGQASSATETNMRTDYLERMQGLIASYPDVTFVYMIGHLDGSGTSGNLHVRNEQIRQYVREHNGILFDFADIESYHPLTGENVMDDRANDNCDYDTDGNSSRDGNWATEWCAANPGNCPTCSCAHSQSLNCELKAKAFWWLLARLAGWDGS